jgi:hypothetical protein
MRKIIRTANYKQSQINRWSGTEGSVSGLLGAQDLSDIHGRWNMNPKDQIALTSLLKSNGMLGLPKESEEGSYVVEINFTSSGHEYPGTMGGSIDNAYSPESEEERTIQEVTLRAQDFYNPNINGKSIELPQPLATEIGEYFRQDIDAAEITGYNDNSNEEKGRHDPFL